LFDSADLSPHPQPSLEGQGAFVGEQVLRRWRR
jgi:hypothetical protein